MTGTQLDHYRIVEKLGEGGMGVVYKAVDLNLDRVVALKLISSDLAADPELTERFKREARLQATLSHPNIALLYTFFFWEGSPVMVMEYIEGETFQRMAREQGPISPLVLVPLFKQALMGVGAAHRREIVHRDIKPANIMFSRKGLVKVMDFGIAKAAGAGAGLTHSNAAMGTSWYMSPEQVLNHPVDARSDIYSLGVTLYEMLSGQVPFRGTSEYEIQRAHVHLMPIPPSVHNPHIPAQLVDAVLRALEKDPAARFQSVEEFSMALGAIGSPNVPPPVASRRVTPAPIAEPLQSSSGPPQSPVIPSTPNSIPALQVPKVPDPIAVAPQAHARSRRSWAPATIAGSIVAVLAIGAFLYFFSAAQNRERARQEAILDEQQAERHRQATEEQEREKRQAAEDERNAEALKQRVQQEEAESAGQQPPSAASSQPSPAPEPEPEKQDEQSTALSNALQADTMPSADAGTATQASRSAPGRLAGLWKGTYMCLQQGENQAEISISAPSAGGVTAMMAFRVPNAKPGTYWMKGRFDQSSGQIDLRFTRWVDHPLNYVPANLTGVVDLRQGVIRGQVIAPGCGNFEMWRNR